MPHIYISMDKIRFRIFAADLAMAAILNFGRASKLNMANITLPILLIPHHISRSSRATNFDFFLNTFKVLKLRESSE